MCNLSDYMFDQNMEESTGKEHLKQLDSLVILWQSTSVPEEARRGQRLNICFRIVLAFNAKIAKGMQNKNCQIAQSIT